jgi:hypothetical protein
MIANPEVRLGRNPEAGVRSRTGLLRAHLHEQCDAERLQCGGVKRLGFLQVRYRKSHVIEHVIPRFR